MALETRQLLCTTKLLYSAGNTYAHSLLNEALHSMGTLVKALAEVGDQHLLKPVSYPSPTHDSSHTAAMCDVFHMHFPKTRGWQQIHLLRIYIPFNLQSLMH